MIKEQMSKSLVFLSESLICSFSHKKQALRSKNLTKLIFFGTFCVGFFWNFKKEQVAHSLYLKKRFEQIPQVTHQK